MTVKENKCMNPEVKDLWLKALRGNKYQQGIGALKTQNQEGNFTYCCLGVLTDLYAESEANVSNLQWSGTCSELRDFCFDNNCALLPKPVRKWAGIEEDFGPKLHLSSEKQSEIELIKHFSFHGITLPILNDNYVPFSVIADIIEKYL